MPGVPSDSVPATPVTVFVGPNNSGKSKVLQEISKYCRTGTKDTTDVLLEALWFTGLDHSAAEAAITHLTVPRQPGETLNVDQVLIGSRQNRHQVPYGSLLSVIQDPASNTNAFCGWFLSLQTTMLDGRSRIEMVREQKAGDLRLAPQNSLQVLFRDDSKRAEVRRIVADAFGLYFVVDPTHLGHLRIGLAERAPVDAREERGIDAAALAFHLGTTSINDASDGVKAFTGIISEVVAGDPRILLIDEPEAFLHPALASKLGTELSRAALVSDKRVLVSTHSPAFVMGCIHSGAPVTIIRLTFRGGQATARTLPSSEILELMRNPLLRSTGVLSGLFYEFVVVTESDADRAFYQEINERLLRLKPEWGIPNCLFINAQNKQTIHTILKPLRKLGIPAAAIVDIDVVKEGGTVWSNLLRGAHVPQISETSLAQLRHSVKTAMDSTHKDMKRDGGLAILNGGDREAARNLFDQLAEYGVFVVPGGELESWLKALRVGGKSPGWLIGIFEKMGEDPDDSNYVKPGVDDVWKFLSEMKQWLVNPSRKGIPE